jgi:REP element-mobilizing transposase RayT
MVRPGALYFVTFRLADSLPREVLAELKKELSRMKRTERVGAQFLEDPERERRKRIELYLDRGTGACSLRDERIAQVACKALTFFDRQRYELEEWVVMPNHVHALVMPVKGWSLSDVLHSWKLKIAKEANRILGKTGERFWQPESFDRVIRDEDEKTRVRRYIRRNPIKARLCVAEEEWPWGSAWIPTAANVRNLEWSGRSSEE